MALSLTKWRFCNVFKVKSKESAHFKEFDFECKENYEKYNSLGRMKIFKTWCLSHWKITKMFKIIYPKMNLPKLGN